MMMRNKKSSVFSTTIVQWWGLLSLLLLSLLSQGRSMDIYKTSDRKKELLHRNRNHRNRRQLQNSNTTTTYNTTDNDSGRIIGGLLVPFGRHPSFVSNVGRFLSTYGLYCICYMLILVSLVRLCDLEYVSHHCCKSYTIVFGTRIHIAQNSLWFVVLLLPFRFEQ
jgi:hypothetical protein